MRAPCPSVHPLALLAAVLLAGCASLPADQEGWARVVGVVDPGGGLGAGVLLDAPDTVAAGRAFPVRVSTWGSSSCTRADGAEVRPGDGVVEIVPFDRVATGGYCTQDLAPHPRTVELRMDEPGDVILRVMGRSLRGDTVRHDHRLLVRPPGAEGPDAGAELLRMDAERDEARRMLSRLPPDDERLPRLSARADSVDRAHVERLREILRQGGWPTRAKVGPEAGRAAFFLVLRASHDTGFQEEALAVLREAFRAGEADGESVAMLTDRLRLARGQPQLYGTQLILHDHEVRLRQVEDEEGIDARRAELGLMPLADYLALVRSMLGMDEP